MYPKKTITGATLMRLTLNILSSKVPSCELGPIIKANPTTMMQTPMPISHRFFLPNRKLELFSWFIIN